MIHAAGVLFVAPNNRGLFLKRGPGGDHQNEWCFPGGKLEKDELPQDAAERESEEEIGELPTPRAEFVEHARSQSKKVDFTTFRCLVSAEFQPDPIALGKEHVGYAWAPIDSPPQPLHPGCQIALDRLGMDELGVAHAIADGRLTSPQTVGGFALYAMRMSGTGVSYRRGLDEFVWRDPEIYLSQDMIDRCAGLPVIMEHPEAATLNSDEFADRVVGAAMFGYVVDDELWCIARIYDADAIEMMDKQQLSTSPAVVFGDPNVNSKTEFKGKTVLIEGNPTILDHLAICRRGVWDKGGPAAGIDVVRKDSVTMTEEEKKADAARKDAEEKEKVEKEEADKKADADAGKKLDTILSHLDSLGKRMDAYDAKCDADEKAKKDAEEKEEKESKDDPKDLAADKAKKDAEMIADKAKKDAEEKEEKEEEEKKADAARKDSELDMRKQIADLQSALTSVRSKMPKPTADADYADMARIQADADRIYSAHSTSAPRPMDGETQIAYRRRLVEKMKHYSDEWKDVDIGVIAVDSKAFENVEKRIYADAMTAAMHPTVAGEGLLEIRRKDPDTGHLIKEFHGQPRAWMSAFSGGPPRLARFNLDKRSA